MKKILMLLSIKISINGYDVVINGCRRIGNA